MDLEVINEFFKHLDTINNYLELSLLKPSYAQLHYIDNALYHLQLLLENSYGELLFKHFPKMKPFKKELNIICNINQFNHKAKVFLLNTTNFQDKLLKMSLSTSNKLSMFKQEGYNYIVQTDAYENWWSKLKNLHHLRHITYLEVQCMIWYYQSFVQQQVIKYYSKELGK